ncbi:hypothetical protein DIPPA_20406 [Diplonema papillatum]|nr:hypothetical protein DIPPA_20406 [Diplonema papillatum]
MVVGNFLLNAGFAAICFLVLSAGRHFRAVTSSWYLHNLDIQGFLRLPSLPLLVFASLYQGSALGSMILIYNPPSVVAFAAGLLSAVFCVMVPLLVFCEVGKGVPSLAFFKEDDQYAGFGWRFMIGKGEWVSTTPKVLWARRFQSVLTVYNEDQAWFGLVRFGSSFALAALSAPVTEDYMSCGHVKLCSALVVLIELAAMIRVWPYVMSRDALADIVTSFSEAGGMLLLAAGYYAGDPYNWTHSTAAVLLTVALFTVGIRVLLDVATELFVFLTHRRVRLQESVFESSAQTDSFITPDDLRRFGKEKSTTITVQLPEHSYHGAGAELSPWHSVFSTETSAPKLSANARQLSASCVSTSPSDCVFMPQGDDLMDAPVESPTLSHASLHGDRDQWLSSSLRSTFRSSPRAHTPSHRSALLVPSSPEPHHTQSPFSQPPDIRRQQSSLPSPRGRSPVPRIGEPAGRSSRRTSRYAHALPSPTRLGAPARRSLAASTRTELHGLSSAGGRRRGSPELVLVHETEHTRALFDSTRVSC